MRAAGRHPSSKATTRAPGLIGNLPSSELLFVPNCRNPRLCLSQMEVAQPSQTTSARKRFRSPCYPAACSVDGRPLYVDVSQVGQRRRYFREYRRDQRAVVVRPTARTGRAPAGDATADATDQPLISTVPNVMGHTLRQSTPGTKQATVSRKARASGRAKGRPKVKARPSAKPHANMTVRPRARANVKPPAACSHRKLPCCGQRVSRCKCIFQVVCNKLKPERLAEFMAFACTCPVAYARDTADVSLLLHYYTKKVCTIDCDIVWVWRAASMYRYHNNPTLWQHLVEHVIIVAGAMSNWQMLGTAFQDAWAAHKSHGTTVFGGRYIPPVLVKYMDTHTNTWKPAKGLSLPIAVGGCTGPCSAGV
jgi:hypothetical protein